MTWRSRSRSIQSDVPVKPRWPTASRRQPLPARRARRRRRVPAERPRRDRTVSSRVQNSRTMLAGRKSSCPRQHARSASRRRSTSRARREQAGVAGDAAHRVGVVVVHLAAEDALAPRAALGRRDHVGDRLEPARAQQRQIDERRRARARAAGRSARGRSGRAAVPLTCSISCAEQHEAEVAVDVRAPGGRLGPLAVDLPRRPTPWRRGSPMKLMRALALDLDDVAVVRPPGRQPRGVREQMAERDVRLPVHAEVVEEARHAIVEADLAARARMQHHRRGGGERLGERGDVEDRVLAHRGSVGLLERPRAPRRA